MIDADAVAEATGALASVLAGTSTWLAPVTISATAFQAREPRVAVDPRGGAIAAWLSADPDLQPGLEPGERVHAALRSPGDRFAGWYPVADPVADPITAGRSTTGPPPRAGGLEVARGPHGNALAVWHRDDGTSHRVLAACFEAGEQVAVGVVLSVAGQDAVEPWGALGPAGEALVVWRRSDGLDQRVQAAFRPAGGHFQAPLSISDPGEDASSPRVAFDPDGNALAVWVRSDGAHRLVQAAFRPAGGDFEAARTVSEPRRDAFAPRVTFDRHGGAVAVWDRADGANRRIQAAFRPAGGDFGTPQTLSPAGHTASSPEAAFDPHGNAVAVWRVADGPDVRVQAAFRPAHGGFEAARTISDPGQKGEPKVALDAEGNAIAVWARADQGRRRIEAAFRPAGGRFQPPEVISPAAQDATAPQLGVDAEGNAVAVWQRVDGANHRVLAAFRPRRA